MSYSFIKLSIVCYILQQQQQQQQQYTITPQCHQVAPIQAWFRGSDVP